MDVIEICKALSNETRLNIVKWLKNPDKNFPYHDSSPDGGDVKGSVCVSSIREKAGIAQPTVSTYLDTLQRAGLLKSERRGRWTYYRRNEETINDIMEFTEDES